MVWTTIPNGDVDAESPGDTTLVTALRDNVPAQAAGDSGAPKNQTASLEQTGGSEAVTQACMRASAIGQTELKTAAQSISSSTVGSWVHTVVTGGIYTLYIASRTTTGTYEVQMVNGASNTSNASYIATYIGSAATVSIDTRYVNTSPPHDLGHGDILLFIFGLVDNVTGDIESLSISPDAPWHYNGPTIITPDQYESNSTPVQMMNEYKLNNPGWRDDIKNNATRAATLTAIKNAEMVKVEITHAVKNADMALLPHSFYRNDLTGKTAIVFDNQAKEVQELTDLFNDGEEINSIIHDKYITVGNTNMPRGFDSSVLCVKPKWKST